MIKYGFFYKITIFIKGYIWLSCDLINLSLLFYHQHYHKCFVAFAAHTQIFNNRTQAISFNWLSFISSILAATEYHLGLLKAKLAKYRAQLLEPSKSAGAKGEGFDVMKSGDARVALIGFPSVGKVSQHAV